ncbi:MAG TPA: VOC family protein [Thermoplasmata archaeon]|jgi:predicted enzyme related to lactoylglutathione lyase|nr:VOC family protein [Thermoplasmata archaeon]
MVEPIEGFSAVTVHVRDIQVARKFYREVLGLHEEGFTEQTGRAVYSFPGTPTILAMHVQRPGEGGREPGTVTGIILAHHDPRAAVEEIRRRGGTITVEPVEVPGPGGTMVRAAFADPDGNEFVISSGHASAPPKS